MNSSAGYQAIGVLMIGGGLLTMYSAYKGNNVKSVLTRSITSAPQPAPTTGQVKR